MCLKFGIIFKALLSRNAISIIVYVYKVSLCVCRFESAPCCLYYFVSLYFILVFFF